MFDRSFGRLPVGTDIAVIHNSACSVVMAAAAGGLPVILLIERFDTGHPVGDGYLFFGRKTLRQTAHQLVGKIRIVGR